jgi:hypothetical protein
MFALLILLAIFMAGFAAGYGIRELRSRMHRRRPKRIGF